ncbi:MAG TPA: cache domain-containing protein [Hyphomicrobiaceae bacterium]|nr:cache domain-containing protein [Hyphomicrobiaceae bacterium]
MRGFGGIITAHATIKGQQIKSLVDKNGKQLGEEVVANAADGKLAEVSYMWPQPGADTRPVQKVSYVTQLADQVCGGRVLQVGGAPARVGNPVWLGKAAPGSRAR